MRDVSLFSFFFLIPNFSEIRSLKKKSAILGFHDFLILQNSLLRFFTFLDPPWQPDLVIFLDLLHCLFFVKYRKQKKMLKMQRPCMILELRHLERSKEN